MCSLITLHASAAYCLFISVLICTRFRHLAPYLTSLWHVRSALWVASLSHVVRLHDFKALEPEHEQCNTAFMKNLNLNNERPFILK